MYTSTISMKMHIAHEAYSCNDVEVMYQNMLIAYHIDKHVRSN